MSTAGRACGSPRPTGQAPSIGPATRGKRPRPDSIIVDRAWIQSWLTSTARQDRAVFQFTTDRSKLEVVLPADAAAPGGCDSRRSAGRAAVARRQSVVDSAGRPSAVKRRFVVELRYHFAGPRPPRGAIQMEFPRLKPEAWMRRMYWQLDPAGQRTPDRQSRRFHWPSSSGSGAAGSGAARLCSIRSSWSRGRGRRRATPCPTG